MTEPILTIDVADEAGTRQLAEDVAAILRPGDVVALSGDLGMGKSAFARAALRALAGDAALEVPSPTFTLVQTYDLPALSAAHFDLYRLGDASELDEIGFDAAMREGVCLVEWPERAAGQLPADTLVVAISDGAGPEGRRFAFHGRGAWGERLTRTLAVRRLLDGHGFAGARRHPMPGDASSRRYERVRTGERSAVLMDWPRLPRGPELLPGRTYGDLVHVQSDPLAFVAVADLLQAVGFRAPTIHGVDREAGLIVMEDLGTGSLVDDAGRPIEGRFVAAAAVLADKDGRPLPRSVETAIGTWTVPDFDSDAIRTELSLFPTWYHRLVTGREADAGVLEDFRQATAPLVEHILALPRGLLLRDVIAPNLVWMEGSSPREQVGFLDFQDAMIGPTVYDIVSLVTDVRRDFQPTLVEAMLDAYAARRRQDDPRFDRAAFDEGFAVVSAQRNLKILGGFARLALRDGRTGYLAHLPRARARVESALAHPVLAPVRLWYERWKRTTASGPE
ncbi:tRNA (adenosine(37)-N6)-threonylcarbamoyltransferase complex ATPase subunit type 1 TsaE [Chthonobacter albigriseus]|uniref:tRNA (adenosine(37)-N6)-threonylcarbamoyltransferase complex ATPase subunit type 1 TsaE n=1 Tax=Chthonobacter albigriseus TaxID=1683161 RepID=UPI0015EE7FF1|nr:tRNA (adenosine(37)-N6)-threonylcarbamoyltransferase complex ATPase subunit type 1 TsaE [Chthonobacter albigriseus]